MASEREEMAALRQRVRELENPLRSLTSRETELLQGLLEGLSNREISERLHLSLPTVKGYVTRLGRKLGAKGRYEIARVARELGFGGP